MSTKKEPRYITIVSGAELKLNLDPAIYDSEITLILGITSTVAPTAKVVPVTLRQAASSSVAGLLNCRVSKGTGESEETRDVRLICETSKLDTAKSALIGKTLTLGGTVTANWTIKAVR